MKNNIFILFVLICFSPVILAKDLTTENTTDTNRGNCQYPEEPHVKVEGVISEKTLLVAQKKVKTYMEEGNQFLECIAALKQSSGEAPTAEQQQWVVIVHNRMVDDMEAVAAEFNSELRNFRGEKNKKIF